MTDMQWQDEGFECLDPEVGKDLWQLDDPELAADRRRLLEDHVEFCDACRLQRDVENRIGRGLEDKSLLLPSDLAGRARSAAGSGKIIGGRFLGAVGGMAMAAGLALMFILPPTPPNRGQLTRAGDESGITRPVEGEIVSNRPLTITWDAIPGATRYKLSIEDLEGGFKWQGETGDNSLTMPAEISLPSPGDFRIMMTTVPGDLIRAGGVNGFFRTADFGSFVSYRLSAAARASHLLFAGGFAAVLGSLIGLVYRRSGKTSG